MHSQGLRFWALDTQQVDHIQLNNKLAVFVHSESLRLRVLFTPYVDHAQLTAELALTAARVVCIFAFREFVVPGHMESTRGLLTTLYGCRSYSSSRIHSKRRPHIAHCVVDELTRASTKPNTLLLVHSHLLIQRACGTEFYTLNTETTHSTLRSSLLLFLRGELTRTSTYLLVHSYLCTQRAFFQYAR